MRQGFTTIVLFDLLLVVSFASAGIFDSFFLGLHSVSSATAINGQLKHPSSQSTLDEQTGISNASGYWHTNSSSVSVPIAGGGQLRVDLCEGDITVPLSFDVKKEMVIKSTDFPFKRSTPLICSWNVKATTNCRRGLITMTINERSRLADIDGCLNGYYTVSPFMGKAKICGRVNTVPAFRWYVEHEQPENVTITLRHIGLNDGYSEGLSFNLSGDCLPNRDDTTVTTAWESYGNWLQQLSSAQWTGGPTVAVPSPILPSFSNESAPFQNASNEEPVTTTTAAQTDVPTISSSSQVTPPTTPSPISHSVVVDPKISNQTNVSNHSSTVHLPRENITWPMHPAPANSSDVLTPAATITQRPRHRPPSPHNVVDVKAPEDQAEIPWLILNPAGQSLSKTNRTPRPRPSLTQTGAIVIPADVLPANVPSTEKVDHTADSDIPWLILKAPDQNEFSPDVYSFAKRPMYQPDPIKEDPNPSYDADESDDSLEPQPGISLYSNADPETQEAAFPAESSEVYSSAFEDDDLNGHGQQVNIRENENAIPWLILKSPNQQQSSASNHHLSDTQNKPTNARPALNISRAPLPLPKSSIRSSSQQSSTKQTPLNYDHTPTNIVPIDAVNPKSQYHHWRLPVSRPPNDATNWMHSGLSNLATTLDPQSLLSTSESPIPASTTNPRRNYLPIALRRNPLLAFDD